MKISSCDWPEEAATTTTPTATAAVGPAGYLKLAIVGALDCNFLVVLSGFCASLNRSA